MPEFNEKAMHEFNQGLIKEFRANGGKAVSGPFVNAPLLLLTTTGAKSGKPFTTPLVYTKDGDRIVIIASKGGYPDKSGVVPQPESESDYDHRTRQGKIPGQGYYHQGSRTPAPVRRAGQADADV